MCFTVYDFKMLFIEVWAIVTLESSSYVPKNREFDNLKFLMSNPDVIAVSKICCASMIFIVLLLDECRNNW